MKHALLRFSRIRIPKLRRGRSRHTASEFELRYVEVFWVSLAIGLVTGHAVRLGGIQEVCSWPSLVFAVLALPVADFVSGLVHWAFDTWGNEKTFWIGPRLIRPFRVHHDKPKDLLGSHFFTTNSDAALANLPFLLIAFCMPLGTEGGRLAALFLVCVGTCGLPTSQIHKWAHAARPPHWVAWLQRRRLILGPAHHTRHHAAPHTLNYCITTGWCNRFLDRIGFFPRLERVVSRITGWTPRHEDEANDHHQGPPIV
jgi:ubiquitin-conjugating enzyme E2 variant